MNLNQNTMKNTIKKIQRYVNVEPDGIFGNVTLQAVAKELGCDDSLRCVQHKVNAHVDGILGKETVNKIAGYLGLMWPSQAEVRTGRSIFGKAGDESNLVHVKPAYQLYFEGKKVSSVRVHKLIARHVEAAFKEIAEAYTPEEIHKLGLDDYSGSFNHRTTASGKSLSMHSWGIALDFAAGKNAYSQTRKTASLARPECDKWWEIWESHGAVSLGRERDYDWMHLQFASL